MTQSQSPWANKEILEQIEAEGVSLFTITADNLMEAFRSGRFTGPAGAFVKLSALDNYIKSSDEKVPLYMVMSTGRDSAVKTIYMDKTCKPNKQAVYYYDDSGKFLYAPSVLFNLDVSFCLTFSFIFADKTAAESFCELLRECEEYGRLWDTAQQKIKDDPQFRSKVEDLTDALLGKN